MKKRPAVGLAVVVRSPLPINIDLLQAFGLDDLGVQRADQKIYNVRIAS